MQPDVPASETPDLSEQPVCDLFAKKNSNARGPSAFSPVNPKLNADRSRFQGSPLLPAFHWFLHDLQWTVGHRCAWCAEFSHLLRRQVSIFSIPDLLFEPLTLFPQGCGQERERLPERNHCRHREGRLVLRAVEKAEEQQGQVRSSYRCEKSVRGCRGCGPPWPKGDPARQGILVRARGQGGQGPPFGRREL